VNSASGWISLSAAMTRSVGAVIGTGWMRIVAASKNVCRIAREICAALPAASTAIEISVGDDLVEAGPDVLPGHDRQLAQPALLEAGRIDAGQALAVPGRALLCHRHEFAQPAPALLRDALSGPPQALEVRCGGPVLILGVQLAQLGVGETSGTGLRINEGFMGGPFRVGCRRAGGDRSAG